MGQIPQRASELNGPYDLAVARLAQAGRELKLAGGPSADPEAWSDQILGAAAAGLDGLAAIDVKGSTEANHELVDRIRRELAEISGIAFR